LYQSNIYFLLFLLLASFANVTAAPAKIKAKSLCIGEEKIIFSCSTGKKVISLCASPDVSEQKGTLYYRFGVTGKVELSYPKSGDDPKKSFTRGGMMYSGGGGEFIRFRNDDTMYTVYSEFGKGWERDGVNVRKLNGAFIKDFPCKHRELYIDREGWNLILNTKLPEDAEKFDNVSWDRLKP